MRKRDKIKDKIKKIISKPKNLLFGKITNDIVFKPKEVSALELQPWIDPQTLSQYQFDPNTLKSLDYTVCSALTDTCGDLGYLPGSRTFVMSDKAFCNLTSNIPQFVNSVADSLDLTHSEAVESVTNYFKDKTLLVQPQGFEGTLYKAGGILQTGGISLYTVHIAGSAKLVGVTGTQLIASQPLLLIGIPTLFGMAFTSAAALGDPNGLYSKTCMTLGKIFNFPMWGLEQGYNAYVAPLIYNIAGVKTTLNATQIAARGAGLNTTEALRVASMTKKKPFITAVKNGLVSFFNSF